MLCHHPSFHPYKPAVSISACRPPISVSLSLYISPLPWLLPRTNLLRIRDIKGEKGALCGPAWGPWGAGDSHPVFAQLWLEPGPKKTQHFLPGACGCRERLPAMETAAPVWGSPTLRAKWKLLRAGLVNLCGVQRRASHAGHLPSWVLPSCLSVCVCLHLISRGLENVGQSANLNL